MVLPFFTVKETISLTGSLNGCLSSHPAHDLGAACIREVLARAKYPAEEVSEVIMGQVLTAGIDYESNF